MATTYDKASLVMIPSGVKEDKLYSIKPTDGSGDFTFSRGSDIEATRVNSSGLIEKAKVNNLLQSNSFDTTWTLNNASVTDGQSGYDGSSDAWLLTATSTSNCRVNQTIGGSGVQSISVYAKANTSNFLAINAIVSGTNTIAYFDLSSGAVGTTGGTPIDADIESVGGGWYRCSLVYNDTNTQMRFLITDGDGSGAVTNGNSIYIQDAQLNHGLVAQDYVETTTTAVVEGLTADLPRLDYHNPDSSTPNSCPSLLLEPSRSNGITASEYFDGGNLLNTTISAEYNTADTLSPEGVYNAAKLTATGTFPRYYDFPTIGDNVDVSISVFAKQGDASVFTIRGNDKSNTAFIVNFDLANGTAELSQFDSLEPTFDIQPFGNGWYRCIVNTNSGSGATAFQIRPISHAQGETGGWTGSNYIYAYGVQYEASASYPTSYIPTYGTAAVRGADDLSDSTFTALPNANFTIFFEVEEWAGSEGNNYQIRFLDASGNRSVQFRNRPEGWRWLIVNDAGGSAYLDTASYTYTKMACRYNGTNYQLFANGSAVGSPFAASDTAVLDNLGSFDIGIMGIKQMLCFPTALTDAECIALTTI